MKKIFGYGVAVILAWFPAAAVIATAQKKGSDVTITGRVYEPAKLAPTIDRIKSLKLPAGFQIAKFAEIENPRMLTVAPDGTVYVSQRTPGTLTMLRDTNGDGAAGMFRRHR